MISIVVPVFNEEESLSVLMQEIADSTEKAELEYEVVFIDDGSTDRSWNEIEQLAQSNARVHGIRFRRNFGKAAALNAGFVHAKGDLIMTLDADLQDDPAEIPNFLDALENGTTNAKGESSGRLDVVSGWKKKRYDPWHKVLPSRVFNWLVSWLTGVKLHDHNCGMKCYRAEVVKEVRLYGELHRFVPVLAEARGFRIGEVVIAHRKRKFGRSKYGLRRFMRGFLDLLTVKFLTGFGQRPQHMLGGLGLMCCMLGFLGMAYLAITWLINMINPGSYLPLHERPLLIYSLGTVLLGAQLMSMGFLAELILAYNTRGTEHYSIAERTPKNEVEPPEN